MRIFFMLGYARDKADAPMLAELIANLKAAGFDAGSDVAGSSTVNPEDVQVEADLYILKSKSTLWLNTAAILASKGARILNSYPASIDTLHKIRAASRLAAGKVPIPRSWVATDFSVIPDEMPLLIKPNIGHGGAGIRMVRDRTELAGIPIDEEMLVQELITPIEDELKLYVIGDRVFGIRKHPDSGERERVAVEPRLEDVALHCGRALGIEIYGVDVLVTPNGPIVVDVNYFPSFRGVQNAARELSDFIGAYANK